MQERSVEDCCRMASTWNTHRIPTWFFIILYQQEHYHLRMKGEETGHSDDRLLSSVQSVTQSCPTLCNPMDFSTPGFPVYYELPKLTQTHVHWVGDRSLYFYRQEWNHRAQFSLVAQLCLTLCDPMDCYLAADTYFYRRKRNNNWRQHKPWREEAYPQLRGQSVKPWQLFSGFEA